MNQPWSNLPNAHHIDWVIESLKDNHEMWNAATWDAASGAAWSAATAPACVARELARVAALLAAYDAASGAAWSAAWAAAYDAARCTILALVAYDDCDEYLKMSYEELRIWAVLSENPAAVLLLPMVYVRDKMHESALV